MNHLLAAGLLAFTAVVAGCSTPTTTWTPQFSQSQLRQVNAPTTGKVGQPVELRVTVEQGNCDDIKLDATVDEAGKTVMLTGRNVAQLPAGTSCNAGGTVRELAVTFTPRSAGTYMIKGAQSEASVQVQE